MIPGASGPGQRTEFYNMTVHFSNGLFLGFVSVFRVSAVLNNVQPQPEPCRRTGLYRNGLQL